MQRELEEQGVLFVSVVKWIFLAVVVGCVVGVTTSVFLKALNASISFVSARPYYYFLLPVALPLSVLLTKRLSPDAAGYGSKVIEAVNRHSGRIGVLVAPVKFAATIITISLGGSAGKEGPAVQIGAAVTSVLSRFVGFTPNDVRRLVICGISGSFASVFGAPMAGAIYGIEMLSAGRLAYDVLLPSFVTGVVSYQVSSWLGLTYFYYPVSFVPAFSELFFLKVAASGVFFGLCAFIFIELLRFGGKLSAAITSRTGVGEVGKAVAVGALLAGFAFYISDKYLGLGVNVIHSLLEGGNIEWYGFLAKEVATSLTLNFGGSGGIVTPIYFVGAAAGNLYARIAGGDPATFAAIGLVSLLAGAANTPIAASILAVELFGAALAPYAAVAAVISFVMTGHRSVYGSQLLAIRKSDSIVTEVGVEVGDVVITRKTRDASFVSLAKRFVGAIDAALNKRNKTGNGADKARRGNGPDEGA